VKTKVYTLMLVYTVCSVGSDVLRSIRCQIRYQRRHGPVVNSNLSFRAALRHDVTHQ